MKNYKEFPEYVRKLPWKFDVECLQKELQSIKDLMVIWDYGASSNRGLTAKGFSFLHSENCPDDEKTTQAVYSHPSLHHKHVDKSYAFEIKHNFKNREHMNGTLISTKLKKTRSAYHQNTGVFNEDYKHTEFYNVYKTLSKYYIIDKFRIIMLPTFSTVAWHNDADESLHIPLETNTACRFVIDDLSYYLPADGSTYQADNCFHHTIFNAGTTDRYNLLVGVTGYKEGSYRLCQHYIRPEFDSQLNDTEYVAKPIKEVTHEELWKAEDYK